MGRDTIQLEDAVSTISGEYLLEFTLEYGIPEGLHPELPGPEETIVDFPKGKVGVYTKFFEFANYRIPLSQFLFDILGYYQIHLSQLSVIGAAKCYTKPLDSLKNWNNRFFWVDERIFPTVVAWRTSAPKDEMPPADSYSSVDVTTLNTRRTPIQKQPEVLLCLVGLNRNFFLGDDVYYIDLFNLISAPNPTKVKTETRPRAAHEVPLLTATANRVIDMEDTIGTSESSGAPSAMEKSPLDFANENPPFLITEKDRTAEQDHDGLSGEIPSVKNPAVTEVVPELDLGREVAAMGPLVNKRHCKRGNDEADANAPPKVLRKDHAASCPTQSTLVGKSLASMGLEAGSTFSAPASQEIPSDVSDPDPLSYAKPQPIPEQDISQSSKGATIAGDPDSKKSSSFTSMVGSPGSIYQSGWGVTNNCRLDTPNVCQDMVDHIVQLGYFSELRHLPNDDFLSQYNINLVREEEIKKLDQEIKSIRAVDTEVQGLCNQTRNLETLLEAEVDMKKAAEAKNAELTKELESLCAQFTDLQVSNDRLSQQVSTLQAQVTGEERIKSAFEEFKKYEDDRVNFRCAEMDARLDALSIDFDEELYPHMLTAIAGHRWVIGHSLRLAVIKCAESTELRQVFADVVSAGIAKGMSEGLKHMVEHEKAKLDLEAIEAYHLEADTKYVAALHALKDLKYPIVDQLEKLKDADA
ncbi:hypothetical protein Tco_0725157 [Tanacetum coccineum]|uniref:Transposase (Putative), gypsy type n=1 Tax=Tanacetum coccineum TaxID=301880 RepID=A0ABQ4YD44_9ASTR